MPAYPYAVETAARFGIDLTAHRTTDVDDFRFESGDLVLAMEVRQCRRLLAICRDQAPQVGLLGAWAHPTRLHIHDPHGLSPEYFETCFSVIVSGVEGIVADLTAARAPAVLAKVQSDQAGKCG